MIDGAISGRDWVWLVGYGWGTGGVLIIRNLEWGWRILSAHQDISQSNVTFVMKDFPMKMTLSKHNDA